MIRLQLRPQRPYGVLQFGDFRPPRGFRSRQLLRAGRLLRVELLAQFPNGVPQLVRLVGYDGAELQQFALVLLTNFVGRIAHRLDRVVQLPDLGETARDGLVELLRRRRPDALQRIPARDYRLLQIPDFGFRGRPDGLTLTLGLRLRLFERLPHRFDGRFELCGLLLVPSAHLVRAAAIPTRCLKLFAQFNNDGVEVARFGERGTRIVLGLADGGIHNEPPSKNVLGGCEF